VVNRFGRLNIQHLDVNSFMYCDALAVTMHLAVLHVPGYSGYYITVLGNNCRKSWMGPGENFTKTLVWGSRVSLTSIYNSESSINVYIRGAHNAVHARHLRGSPKLGLKK
jgi:hypothetical protein